MKRKVPVHLMSGMCNLSFWEHGGWDLHNLTFGPEYDIDAYVASLFGGEAHASIPPKNPSGSSREIDGDYVEK